MYLGQHFLTNKTVLRKIVEALELKPGETVIEIGAGHGELTLPLLQAGVSVIAIEKDSRLAKFLMIQIKNANLKMSRAYPEQSEVKVRDPVLSANKLSISSSSYSGYNGILATVPAHSSRTVAGQNDPEQIAAQFNGAGNAKCKIIEGDALREIKNLKLKIKSFKITGNIPFYITGRLLRVIGELKSKPKLCVFTLQKEVAERICAKPPRMNLLAASVQFWAEPEIIGQIPASYFRPQPKVDSAIIKLKIKSQKLKVKSQQNFYQLIKILFRQPRKTILNNLISGLNRPRQEIEKKLKKIGCNPLARPQNLGLNDLKQLARVLHS